MRVEDAMYFRIKDNAGEDYFIAAKTEGVLGRFLRQPGHEGRDSREFSMADVLGFDLDSLERVGMSEVRFAERTNQLMAKGSSVQDIFFMGYSTDPAKNLALKGEAQALKV